MRQNMRGRQKPGGFRNDLPFTPRGVCDVKQFMDDIFLRQAARVIQASLAVRKDYPHQRTSGAPVLAHNLPDADSFQAYRLENA